MSSISKFQVFEFNVDDESVEKTSQKLLHKSRPRKPAHNPHSALTKHNFRHRFARGTKTQQKDYRNEPLDVDDSDDDSVIERKSGLDAIAPSCSSSCNPMTNSCPNYLDSQRFFSGVSSYLNEPVGINLDEGSIELSSSSTSVSDPAENEGPSEEQMAEHGFGGSDIDTTVVVSPDYTIYEHGYSIESRFSFSCSSIKLEDSSTVCRMKGPFSFEWTVADIIGIESQWCESVETATVSLHLRSKDTENAYKNSGIIELKFVARDPYWPERQEAIISLDVRYKARWNVVFNIDKASKDSAFVGQNSIFFSKHCFSHLDESFEDVSYPKGDPDAVSISKRDIELLQPETFINDTIIDFYIKYLKNKIEPEEKNRFHFFNSFFFRKLADLDKGPSTSCEGRAAYQRVHKWTRKVDLFKKDYIFVPVNFSLHWSLIVICHPGEVENIADEETEKLPRVPCILHMDSIKGSHRGLKNLFRSYLCEEWKERHAEPAEDISSNFLNLQFLSLEPPQQENLFDCGLFLLHYVELFVEQAPVNFSPFRITKLANFLNKDWFPPAEAYLKRAHIKKLIYEIIENNSQLVPPAACDDKYSSELLEVNEAGTGIEFLHETCNSAEICHGSYNSSADQEIDFTVLAATPLRGLQYFRESELVSKELKTENFTGSGSLTDGNNQSFGQKVLLNRFKNVMPPIEEGEETACSAGYKIGGPQVAIMTEPLTNSTRRSCRRWLQGFSMDPKENKKGDPSCGTPSGVSQMSSGVRHQEDHVHMHGELFASNLEEEKGRYESSPTSRDGLAACIVEDSQESSDGHAACIVEDSQESSDGHAVCIVEDSQESSDGHVACVVEDSQESSDGLAACIVVDSQESSRTDDVNESEKNSPCQARILGLSNREADSTQNTENKARYISQMSELEEHRTAKRPRHMLPDQRICIDEM